MMKTALRLASLTFLMFGCAVASEFRPPMGIERGSQRNDNGHKSEKESPWDIAMWSTGFSRNADKAFQKHGSTAKPLSALLFGKDSFKVSDAFGTSGATSAYTEEFNANLGATTFNPKVTYSEQGVSLGLSLGYRVMDGKGMVGIKAHVPLTTVRMERDDQAELAATGGVADHYVIGDQFSAKQVLTRQPNAAAVDLQFNDIPLVSNLYRVSLVQNLPVLRGGQVGKFITDINTATGGAANINKTIQVGSGAAYNRVAPGGNDYRDDVDHAYTSQQALPYAIAYAPGSKVPRLTTRAVALPDVVANAAAAIAVNDGGADRDVATVLVDIGNRTQGAKQNAGGNYNLNTIAQPVAQLPALGALAPNTMYVFNVDAGANARPGDGGNDARILVQKTLLDTAKDNLWLVTAHAADGRLLDAGTDGLLQALIKRYASQSAEEWLWANGYTMQTNQRTGLGDITINPFYDHMFSDDWSAGVYLHVGLPTGGTNKTGTNPYKAVLGNGNHVEVGGGAKVAWQALSWMGVRLDAMAAQALRGKEYISAPFKDATIKGMGPVIGADIDYTFVKGSIDTTLTHPHAASLATTLGYDFVYKTKDNVSLASNSMTFDTLENDPKSWFGGTWVDGQGFRKSPAIALDPAVQAKGTERIHHVFRAESSWHATHHMSLFVGGSTVPFGQNATKMSTIYGGMNVKF